MTTARDGESIPKSRVAIAVIVALVGAISLGYAVWRTLEGLAVETSLPLVVSGVLCLGTAAMVLITARRRPPEH